MWSVGGGGRRAGRANEDRAINGAAGSGGGIHSKLGWAGVHRQ